MRYDYEKAARLDDKARLLLHRHRTQIGFRDAAADARHVRAIKRIKGLMGRHWDSDRRHRLGQRLLNTWA